MCSVGSSSLLRSLVDLDVLHHEIARVKAFRICICLGVLQEAEQKVG
jgi:hypothetical protein